MNSDWFYTRVISYESPSFWWNILFWRFNVALNKFVAVPLAKFIYKHDSTIENLNMITMLENELARQTTALASVATLETIRRKHGLSRTQLVSIVSRRELEVG